MNERSELPEWTSTVIAELELDVEVDVKLVLDLARDAAHAVERPAAPLTTYLLGVAAAQRSVSGVDPAVVEAVAARLRRLAEDWRAARG